MQTLTNYAALELPQVRRKSATNSTLMLLFAGDLIIIAAACYISFYARFAWFGGLTLEATQALLNGYSLHLAMAIFSMASVLYVRDSYSIELLARYRYGAVRLATNVLIWVGLFLFVSLFFKISPTVSRGWVGLSGASMAIGLVFWRIAFCKHFVGRSLLQSIRRKTLVVGWNPQAQKLFERSEACTHGGDFFPFRLRSLVVLDANSKSPFPHRLYRGDDLHSIERQLKGSRHDTLIVANTNLPQKQLLALQELCGREMVDFMVIPDFVQTLRSSLQIESFVGLPLLTQTRIKMQKTSSVLLKRGLDIIGAIAGLALFAPIIAFFCMRVYRESPGPVFYKQERLGQNGQTFKMIKIRSMRLDADKSDHLNQSTLRHDDRILSVGAFMRKCNIDELPQFWNVLRGEMSLVGPRPERVYHVNHLKSEISYYNVRHLVKPGITGWAQVNGWRGDTCLESRIACDLEYIERWNFWFDIYICLKTCFATKNAY